MNPIAILRDLIDEYFGEHDFRLLCFDLKFDYDNIRGETKKDKVQEFIIQCHRFGRSNILDMRLMELRPNVNWPKLTNHSPFDTIEQKEQSYVPLQGEALETLIDEDDLEEANLGRFISKDENNETNNSQNDLELITSGSDSTKISQEKVAYKENESSFLDDAEKFSRIAIDYFENQQPVQSHAFARKAAEQFLKSNRKLEAAKQYIFAAEVYLQKTFFHAGMVSGDLDQALNLLDNTENPYLKAKILLLKVQVSLFTGRVGDTEKLWNEINTLLPTIKIGSYKISSEMTIQKASVARLDGNFQEALAILETANKNNEPGTSNIARLDLLWSLLFLYSELGNWNEVERINKTASAILNVIENPILQGRWRAHYASSLARSGQLEKARETYDEALNLLENSGATAKHKHHFYQNMAFVLNRYGGIELFETSFKYESRRLDLMLKARNENIGFEYLTKATNSQFDKNNTQKAFLEASVALMIAWREGDWFLLNLAYDTLSKLHFLAEDYVDAVLAAIYTEHGKEIPRLTRKVLNIQDTKELNRLFDELIREWSTLPDQANALMALSKCVDILPSGREEELYSHLVQVLTNSHQRKLKSKVYLHGVATLNELVPRLSEKQLEEILRVCLTLLSNGDSYNLRKEILGLLGSILFTTTQIEASLEQSLFDTLQLFCETDTFKSEAEIALTGLAKNSSVSIRNKIVHYFSKNDDTHSLVFLGEKVSEDKVRSRLEKILLANTPHKDEKGRISYSGINVRSINNFNDVLPASLYDFIIDGLIGIITNPDGFPNQKSHAIMTLRWLPVEALRKRSKKISEVLLSTFDGNLAANSSGLFLNWFGTTEEIRRNCLYALGHIYAFAPKSVQKQIRETIITAATDKLALIRLGAAMALRLIEHPSSFSDEMTYTLMELFHDEDPQVREWAYSAAGHRMADNSITHSAFDFLLERLIREVKEESVTNARAGTAYALRILSKRIDLPEAIREKIQAALEKAANDINYQVRRKASDIQ